MKLKIISFLLLVILLLPLNVSAAELNFCERTSPIWQFAGYFFVALKIAVPLIIIILGIVDFAKAVVSSDDKAISNAATGLLKRFIIGVIIFFIPTIVDLVFGLIANFTGDITTPIAACEECLLDPTDGTCEDYVDAANAEVEQWFT